MIKTRLVGLLSHVKKYIVYTILWQWAALLSQVIAVFTIADLLERVVYGAVTAAAVKRTIFTLAIVVVIRFFCERMGARSSYLACVDVKRILREKIYEKMLKLGASYSEQVSSSEVVQVSTEGVEQLETYFGKYLPQLFYSLLAWMATIVQSKGFDAQTAGFYSSLFVLIGIPGSFLIPILANRMRRQSALGICVGVLNFSGVLLLILARSSASVLCAMLLCGVGTSTVFSFGIASFSIHTENAADAAELSGMAQSLGYFLGAVGPFALGKTFSLASNWTVPLAMLLAFSGIEILAGYMAGRPIVIPAEKARTEKL